MLSKAPPPINFCKFVQFCVIPLSLKNDAHSYYTSGPKPTPMPMASLHKLLSQDGFHPRKPIKKVNWKIKDDSITLPIYICHDRRSFDSSSSRPRSIAASDAKPVADRPGPAIEDVATKAMVAILSGYVAQYSRDPSFRASTREKCRCCCERRKKADAEILSLLEMGIESIERLVEVRSEKMDLESLQRCIKILNAVADSTNNDSSSSSCRKTNSYISACAHLYLSIVYKIGKNDKISARNLLQVFCDAPFLARTRLLPQLWEHFFLPHLLHLKIWYSNELAGCVNDAHKDKKIKGLNQLYREQMDAGTLEFALYYKEWLKVGAQAPSLPTVALPSKSKSNSKSRRKSSESSTSHHSSSSKLLYQAVFGANATNQSMDFDDQNGSSKSVWDSEAEDVKHYNYIQKKAVSHRRSSSLNHQVHKAELWPDSHKSDYFRFLGCRTEPAECFVSKIEKIEVGEDESSDVAGAIATVCSSESLTECEGAVRAVSKAWLSGDGDTRAQLEGLLSRAAVIQGILEVVYVSNDDEILELAVSILAEMAAKNEANRRCILASDPQLAVTMRLLRSSSLFLKAAALLYLVKPKAKQMVSMEWIPLVLRVLEFGDQLQILFTVKCSPHEAAYYFLNELLTGFDEDKNFENAKQIISLGGLGLLVRRMDVGDMPEKTRAASVLRLCIRADGSCRHFLVKNVKRDAILSLLVLEQWQGQGQGHALALLYELLCVSRRHKRIELLSGLKEGWKWLNTLQILLLRLHKARPEERPMVAVVLLELDLFVGDASECSVYREDAVDAIIEALDCCVMDERIQQQVARALLILGGRFSYTGEEEVERWLLRKAEIRESCIPSQNEDEKMRREWQRKAALVLLTSGNTRLLSALSDSLANSIPSLARACLITIGWISHSLADTDLRLAACSIIAPRLMECLVDNTNNLEEKILASFSLHSLTNGTGMATSFFTESHARGELIFSSQNLYPDYFSQQLRVENNFLGCLQKLSRATWTAKELITFIKTSCSSSLGFLSD
ncbi:putative E3 ubiquitin-protein ligase LIN isoform X2 [Salvia miltiorrhiza]|uniref:putative E3 ubiquitin-protein ligase LIN isoform X2 n=1 Tax=Salvia miltiorrhiza TaxID=226208 RepID=UPI0025ACEE35|nr:putative E3 ubiquitin-protein ligase LIN isoform X2 [Salvia miltiorrhiza]